jgi:hypothetical protein
MIIIIKSPSSVAEEERRAELSLEPKCLVV